MSSNPNPLETLREYKYKPFEHDQQVRLLKLRAAATYTAVIECELGIFDLPSPNTTPASGRHDSSPNTTYIALSWCWGKEPANKTITIQSDDMLHKFYVKQTLEDALRGLRDPIVPRYFWIDAICMNQDDHAERNIQVGLMNRIYSSAKIVYIWLGAADANTDHAMRFIKKKLLNVWDIDSIVIEADISIMLTAFWALINRPWFTRRWVIQEVVLARKAQVWCGKHSIGWNSFAHAVSLFVEIESTTKRFSAALDTKIRDLFGNVSQIGAAVLVNDSSRVFHNGSDSVSRDSTLSLEYLVSRYSVFEASQPRDAIYALLAIAQDANPQEKRFTLQDLRSSNHDMPGEVAPSVRLAIRGLGFRKIRSKTYPVDYGRPTAEVFQQFIEFAVHNSDSKRALDIICCPWAPRVTKKGDQQGLHEALDGHVSRKSHQRSVSVLSFEDTGPTSGFADDEEIELPSWIASQHERPFAMIPVSGSEQGPVRMERNKADPLVGPQVSGQSIYSANGSVGVNLEDVKFEKLGEVYSMSVKGIIFDQIDEIRAESSMGGIPWEWFTMAGWTPTVPDAQPPERFWRTLVADRNSDLSLAPPYYARACKEAVKGLQYGHPLNTASRIAEGGSSVLSKFLGRVQAVVWGRCLMVTKGDRLGLVYPSVQKDDFICILYGCSVPVVLRRLELTSGQKEQYIERRREKMMRDWRRAFNMLRSIRGQQKENRRNTWSLWIKYTWKRSLRLVRGFFMVLLVSYLFSSFTLTTKSSKDVFRVMWTRVSITTSVLFLLLALRVMQPVTRIGIRLMEHAGLPETLMLMVCLRHAHLYSTGPGELTVFVFLAFSLFPGFLPLSPSIRRMMTVDSVIRKTMRLNVILRKTLTRNAIIRAASKPHHLIYGNILSAHDYVRALLRRPNFEMALEPPPYYWRLIGPAYVHGMMNGEIHEWRKKVLNELAFEETKAEEQKRNMSPDYVRIKMYNMAHRQVFHLC